MDFLQRLKLRNPGWGEIVGEMFLRQLAKFGGSLSRRFVHKLFIQIPSLGQKSDNGMLLIGVHLLEAIDLALESRAHSLPALSKRPKTYKN